MYFNQNSNSIQSHKSTIILWLYPNKDQTVYSISQHYCTCLMGSHTPSSCVHILSVIWFSNLVRNVEFLREIIRQLYSSYVSE